MAAEAWEREAEAAGFDPKAVADLAQILGRERSVVVRDLGILRKIRSDPIWAVNQFFVLGGAWLWHEVTEYQAGGIKRFNSDADRVMEIWPRGHMKTTLMSRALLGLKFIAGEFSYGFTFSLGERNYKSNMDALWSIFTGPQFRPLQWLAAYFHGLGEPVRKDNIIVMPGGRRLEWASILSNTRGANSADAQGRPDLVMLDDIIPTEAAYSQVSRQRIEERYLSSIIPMMAKGGIIRGVGTTVHRDDLVSKIATGKLGNWVTTPIEDRAAIRPDGSLLFPERFTQEGLETIRVEEYEALGRGYLFRREYFNDVSEADTHPLSPYAMDVHAGYEEHCAPDQQYRVIAVDHAQGLGLDYFVMVEAGRDHTGHTHVIDLFRSNTVTVPERCEAVAKWVRRRQPHALVVEDTSESRTFIDVLKLYLEGEGLYVNLQTPTAASRGDKNHFIVGWLVPLFRDNRISTNLSDTSCIFRTEMVNFSMDSKSNSDDVLDATANACKHLETPKPPVKDFFQEQIARDIHRRIKAAQNGTR